MTGALPEVSGSPNDEIYQSTSLLSESIDELVKLTRAIPTGQIPDLNALANELPPGAMIYPGTVAFERAVSIGNLLYSRKTPAAIVQPRDTQDVVTIIKFCRANNIQFTVKNGGHSYAGYCLNKGGIVMDMGTMMQTVLADHEATIQGGATWESVYARLVGKDRRCIIIGGQCPTVGVSGFTLGGGLSPFSRSYGLGIDNIREMTVVTADGSVVTLDAYESDPKRRRLFWALRGGGGGNFGVLVEFKARIHRLKDPHGHVVCGQLTWDLDKHLEEFNNMIVAFDQEGCSRDLTLDAIWRSDVKPGKPGKLLGQMTVIYNGGSKADCEKALDNILKCKPDENDIREMHWSEWVHTELGLNASGSVYQHHASFIFARGALDLELVRGISELVKEAYDRYVLPHHGVKVHFLWDHIGAETANYAADATAFPWRTGAYVCNLKLIWTCQDLSKEMFDFALKTRKFLDPYTIDGKASYVNYIDSTVEDWQGTYYGQNYPALQAVKAEWDPSDFFRFERSIELPNRPHKVEDV
ncbi:FAD-binding domain protein [Ceratobasidium sp. AG-Ba]|nr:FAD-binding domain protein [Ceratobasidium sp. AG-Ba]QRW10798.1 FAD-binding domain protein [Ceratobasidium sp. AG-Ba]